MMTRLAPVVVNEAGDVLVRPGLGVECGLRRVPVFSSLITVRTMTLTVSPWLFLPALICRDLARCDTGYDSSAALFTTNDRHKNR